MHFELIMTSSSTEGISNEATKNDRPTAKEEMAELRRLLFAPEITQLENVQKRLDNITFEGIKAEDLSRMLPDAIIQRSLPDEELTEVLRSTVEDAIYTSVRKDADVISTAIFPVLLPGIQKAIATAISEMTQSLNETLDNSLSAESLSWRIEALVTGKSFAEVVLLHSLLYRVEQVFLIHKETGLVLQHIVAPEVAAQDADLVAAMLTAIRDFVKDSFQVGKTDSLDSLQFGELTLWIEPGSQAILAGVIRGNAPKKLRLVFQDAIAKIHLNQSKALHAFSGDTTPFEASRPILETCLQAQYESKPEKSASQKPSPVLWIVLGTLVIALLAWFGFSIRDSLHWTAYLAKLNAEPGIVVTKVEKHWGKHFISGLRDPLAADPIALMQATGVNSQAVFSQWQPYLSLEPALLAARAKQLLQPPETVSLEVDENGILYASGSAAREWVVQTRQRVQLIPGITQFRAEQLSHTAFKKLESSREQIEKQIVPFPKRSLRLTPRQKATLRKLSSEIKHLLDSGQVLHKNVLVKIVGHANEKASETNNLILSQARANAVLSALVSQGFNPNYFEAVGVGSTKYRAAELGVAKSEINRSVSFEVAIADNPNPITR